MNGDDLIALAFVLLFAHDVAGKVIADRAAARKHAKDMAKEAGQ